MFLQLYCDQEIYRLETIDHNLIGKADDSTLMAVVPSPGVRVTVADSLRRDLGKVRE